MLKLIKSLDLFGHPIVLSFNNKGNTHNTLLGGSVSILIRLMMLAYIITLTKKLVLYEDDNNTSVESRQKLSELGVVNFNETQVDVFFMVWDSVNERFMDYYEEGQKYLKFYGIVLDVDLPSYKTSLMKMRVCTEQDF